MTVKTIRYSDTADGNIELQSDDGKVFRIIVNDYRMDEDMIYTFTEDEFIDFVSPFLIVRSEGYVNR